MRSLVETRSRVGVVAETDEPGGNRGPRFDQLQSRRRARAVDDTLDELALATTIAATVGGLSVAELRQAQLLVAVCDATANTADEDPTSRAERVAEMRQHADRQYRAILALLYDGSLEPLEVIRRKELLACIHRAIYTIAAISPPREQRVPRLS